MFKKWMLGILLVSISFFTQATTIVNDELTGAGMAGIEVTAFFGNGTQDTQIWSALSPTLGGVIANDWSLTLDGNTFGDVDLAGNLIGVWELTNLSEESGITALTVNAGVADVYFDIIPGIENNTEGSLAGRPFAANDPNAEVAFSNVYSSPDLYATLDITNFNLGINEQLLFLTDTDTATDSTEIPEPSTILVLALALIVLNNSRKKTKTQGSKVNAI